MENNKVKQLEEKDIKSIESGLAIGLSFITIAFILLFMDKEYFLSLNMTRLIAISILLFGIAGIGFEVDKLNNSKLSLGSLVVGAICISVAVFLYFKFNDIFIYKIIVLILFTVGFYGIFESVIRIIKSFFSGKNRKRSFVSLFLFLIQIVSFFVGISQILVNIKDIK